MSPMTFRQYSGYDAGFLASLRRPCPGAEYGRAPAVGTVVASLPAGCVSAPVGGVEYQLCNGVYYRAAFKGDTLVYVVQKP